MLVENWMSKTVITTDVNDSMNNVMNLMKKHHIGMVPVMKKGKLVGGCHGQGFKKVFCLRCHYSGGT